MGQGVKAATLVQDGLTTATTLRLPRPANDSGQRPDVPAGVGPMARQECGEASSTYSAGVQATNDDEDVYTSSHTDFEGQPRAVSPVLKGDRAASRK